MPKKEIVKSRTVAYIRVSTNDQDVENQKLEILKLANERSLGKVEFIEEVVSGRKSWKDREVSMVLEGLVKDDALVVSELSRLGRSMLEIMEILSIAVRAGVRVYAAKGAWSLDGSLQSKVVAMALSMASEIERDLISQRTKAALATKKAQGVILGRPKGPGKSKLDEHRDEIVEQLACGVPKKRIAANFGTTPENLRHWAHKREISY